MKQDKAKRTPKWVLPVVIAAAVLVVAGILLAIFLGPWNQSGDAQKIQSELYWNVDRSTYVDPNSGMSIREPDANGLYTIRFAVNGEQVELKAADKRLVNSIDFMDVMGLVFDADGLIIEAVDPTVIYKEIAKDFFVKSVSADKIVANSSIAMNGMEVEIPLSETTGIYNVDPAVQVVGQPGECQLMDKILVYGNEEGATTHVFIKERAKGDGVYLRVERFYDTTSGKTTRVPDENGIYTMLFAYEGQQMELKCKDKELVSKLDSLYEPKHQVGLIFDEEGYIVDYVTAEIALRGQILCGYMNVTAIDGNTVTVEDFVGDGADGIMDLYIDADCDIFLTENGCEADFIGQRVDGLKLGDMVYVYGDLEGKPVLVYIYRRVVDADMYYNFSRKYDSEKMETTRVPDENGWYVFDMFTLNKRLELRTKSKEIASKVDAVTYNLMGLKVSGTTILEVYDPYCLSGYSHVGIGRFVTQVMGTITRIVSSSNFESGGNYMMSDDHIMIDVTGDYSAKEGAQVTLREGDRLSAYTNPKKQISHGVVTARYYEGSKLYYNVTRKYDATLLETTRVPDADGYYVFDMICEGKEVQVKTKDKAMATFIDKDSYCFRALKVSGGIIKAAYQNVSALKYSTRALANYFYDSTNPDGTINFYYMTNGERRDKTTSYVLSDKTVIYNYSTAATKVGEKTTLKKGDMLQAFASMETNEMLVVYVMERKVDSKLYWSTGRKYNSTTEETTRELNEDGYYTVDLISEDGEIKTFKTKDKKVMSKVDSFATAFGLTLDGDVILKAHNYTSVKGIMGYAAGYYDAMKISSSKITFVRNRPASASTGSTVEYNLAKGNKVVNVSSYSPNFGAKDKIEVGDRTASYVNENNEIVCTFIVNENTHKDGAISNCPHCGKDVWWEPFAGTVYAADSHYYIPYNYTSSNKVIGYTQEELAADPNLEQYELIFDLNGYSWDTTNYKVALSDKVTMIDTVGSGRLQLSGSAVLNVKDTTINCVIDVTSGSANVKLEGKVETSKSDGGRMKLGSGAKLDISKLSPDSKITVSAKDVFTTERDDIDKFLNVFTPASENGRIEKSGNALTYVQKKVEYTTEQIIEIANSAEFAANFANGGTVTAVCPVCGVEEEWSPIGAGTAELPKTVQTKITGHVYYDQDTWTTSVNILTGETSVGCVYLNGKTVTGVGRIRANVAVNIMGNGTIVKFNDPASTNDDNALFVLDSANTKLNIYGGKFVNNKAEQPLFAMTATTSRGTGTIYAGTFESTGAILEMTNAEAKFNLLGGTFKGGDAKIDAGVLTIGGGNVESNVVVARPATLVLSGTPKVTGALDLSSGALATLTDLDTSASILVKANGTFTQPSDKAADYITAKTFKIPAGYQAIVQEGGCLWTAPEGYVPPEDNTPDWSENAMERIDQWTEYFGAEFDAASEAGATAGTVFTDICPVCGARNVTWTAKNSSVTSLSPGKTATHYYLSENYGRTTQDMIGSSQEASLCLYLNNKTYTTIGRFFVKNQVNIFDDNKTDGGGITRIPNTLFEADPNKTAYLPLPVFDVTTNGDFIGELNIYGGHYENQQTIVGSHNPNGTTLINLRAGKGKVNIYGGTFANTGNGEVITINGGELKLAGAPTIAAPGIVLAGDVVMNIDELAATASVAIKGENGKVITAASDNAATVKDSFTIVGADGLYLDINTDNQLYITDGTTPAPDPEVPQNPVQQIIETANSAAFAAQFAGGERVVTAECPVCGVEVEWSRVDNYIGSSKSGHYYFNQSEEYAGHTGMNFLTTGGKTCIYLNNKSVTTAGRIGATKEVNILGNGTITRVDSGYDGSASDAVSLLDATSVNTVLSIYGGTFINNEPSMPLMRVTTAGIVNIYGGTFDGAVQVNAGTLTIGSAEVKGNVTVAADAKVTLTGAPKVTGILDLTSGVKATLDNLDTDARILVKANGIFTEATDKAADYVAADTFSVPEGYQAVAALRDLLWTGVEGTAEPEYPIPPVELTPEQQFKARVDAWVAENKDAFTAGTNLPTTCPFCGEENVTWTAKANGAGQMVGGHFYLASGYTSYTNMNFVNIGSDTTATTCVYLNGQNAEIIGRMRVYGKATLNVFGEGTITKNHTDKGAGGSADYTKAAIFDIGDAATVNIYGGTYISNQKYVELEGAVTNPEGTPVINVAAAATVNIYGANLQVAADANGEPIRSTAAGTINLYAGTISGGTATHPNSISMQAGSLKIGDATVAGNVAVAEGAAITLTGEPAIAMLDLTSGVKATIAELGENASITVKANGAFTVENDNAAQYAAAFVPAAGYRDVFELNKALWTAPAVVDATAKQIMDTANSAEFAAKFANGGTVTAVCPVCGGEAVQWTAIGGGTEAAPLTSAIAAVEAGGHVYFAEDTYSTYSAALLQFANVKDSSFCVYLNGKTIQTTGYIDARRMNINIMGNGQVIRNESTVAYGLIWDSSALTILNIYGGNYVNKDVDVPLIDMATSNGKGVVNVYGGTFENTVGANLKQMVGGAANLYGGTFKAGALQVEMGSLKIGSATVAGDVTVAAEATLELTGTPLILGNLDLLSGVKATVTELTDGTRVTVKASGAFTAVTENAALYAPYFIAAEGYETVTVVEDALFTQAVPAQAAVQLLDEATLAVKA